MSNPHNLLELPSQTFTPYWRKPMIKTPSHFSAIAVAVFATVTAPTLAFAHAKLVSSSPAANAKLATSPKEYWLKFSEDVAPSLTTVEIADAKGVAAVTANGKKDCVKDACKFAGATLQAGVYTVKYHVVSSDDGHVVDGKFNFTVKAGAN
jgi:methionine-rich copper-binding protein CopC